MENSLNRDPVLITIITPSYNRAGMIGTAIESVVNQDYASIEHVIIDGGSTDGTLELLAKYPHLKVVSEPDKGMYDALNKGVKLAHGEIIGFLNTDDFYPANILSEIAALFTNRAVEAVAGQAEVVRVGKDSLLETFNSVAPCNPDHLLQRTILEMPAFNAWFFRRSIFEKVGSFNDRYRIIADREFMIRLALAGITYASTDHTTYFYLQHAGSLTFSKHRPYLSQNMHERMNMTDIFLRKAGVPEQARQYLRKTRTTDTLNMAGLSLDKREFGEMWFYIRKGIRFDSLWLLKFSKKLYLLYIKRLTLLVQRIGSFSQTFKQSGIKGIIQRLDAWHHRTRRQI